MNFTKRTYVKVRDRWVGYALDHKARGHALEYAHCLDFLELLAARAKREGIW